VEKNIQGVCTDLVAESHLNFIGNYQHLLLVQDSTTSARPGCNGFPSYRAKHKYVLIMMHF